MVHVFEVEGREGQREIRSTVDTSLFRRTGTRSRTTVHIGAARDNDRQMSLVTREKDPAGSRFKATSRSAGVSLSSLIFIVAHKSIYSSLIFKLSFAQGEIWHL